MLLQGKFLQPYQLRLVLCLKTLLGMQHTLQLPLKLLLLQHYQTLQKPW